MLGVRSILSAVGVVALGYGAYRYYSLQTDILKDADISVVGVNIKDHSLKNVTIGVKAKIVNNSEYSFILRNYDISIFMDNVYAGNIKNSNIDQKINGKGESSIIEFDFSFDPSQLKINVLSAIQNLLSKKGNTLISFNGSVGIRKGVIFLDIPFDVTYKLKELVQK